jgi:DNA-3-methyladenine glycosylase II
MSAIRTIDERSLTAAVAELCARDEEFAAVYQKYGTPPLWARPAGYHTLLLLILEQQVSLASARAAYVRLQAQVGEITPASVLELDDGTMRAVGFSRQKSGYARHLSQAILEGRFDPDELPELPDDEVKQRLTALKGIGVWTAEVYLLMVLCRADAWPVGDVALAQAIMEVKNLPVRPGHDEVARIGEQWRPWRAAAARILWHHYLSVRKK